MHRFALLAALPLLVAATGCHNGRIDVDVRIPIPVPVENVPLCEIDNSTPYDVIVYVAGDPVGMPMAPWSRRILTVFHAVGQPCSVEVRVVKFLHGNFVDTNTRAFRVRTSPLEPIPIWIL